MLLDVRMLRDARVDGAEGEEAGGGCVRLAGPELARAGNPGPGPNPGPDHPGAVLGELPLLKLRSDEGGGAEWLLLPSRLLPVCEAEWEGE